MPCSNILLVAAVGATALLAAAAPKHSFQYKMLNGPPSEFKQMSPPPADASGVYSSHSSGRFNFGKSDTDAPLAWSTNFNVDSVNGFAFAAFVADKGATYALLGPDSKPIDLSKRQSKVCLAVGVAVCIMRHGMKKCRLPSIHTLCTRQHRSDALDVLAAFSPTLLPVLRRLHFLQPQPFCLLAFFRGPRVPPWLSIRQKFVSHVRNLGRPTHQPGTARAR